MNEVHGVVNEMFWAGLRVLIYTQIISSMKIYICAECVKLSIHTPSGGFRSTVGAGDGTSLVVTQLA